MIEREDVKIFIEGEPIPFNSVSVTFAANSTSTASISMPSSWRAPQVPRLSMVHIFYRDPYEQDKKRIWKFLWEGVVIGSGFSKTPRSSSFILSCADDMVYMDVTKVALFDASYFDANYVAKRVVVGQTMFHVDIKRFANHFMGFFTVDKDKKVVELLEMIQEFLNNWYNILPLYEFHMDRLRFNNKISTLDDDTIAKMFSAEALKEYVNTAISAKGGGSTIQAMFIRALSLIMYNYVNAGTCKYVDDAGKKTLNKYILKPNTFFLPPPKCNVIFPDAITRFDTSENYLNPTRGITNQVLGVKDSGIYRVYLSPDEIVNYIYGEKKINADALFGTTEKGVADKDKTKTFYLDEEVEGALISTNIRFDSKLWSVDSDADDDTTFNERLALLTEYFFNITKSIGDKSSMTLKFSPQIVANYPIMYLDKYSSLLGNVASVTHNLSADGAAYTTVNIDVSMPFDTYKKDVDIPRYIPLTYRDRTRLDKTYDEILGCKSIIDGNQEMSKRDPKTKEYAFKIPEIINPIFNIEGKSEGEYYKQARIDRAVRYAYEYTKRTGLASLGDIKKFYGMENSDFSRPDDSWKFTGGNGINPFDYRSFIDGSGAGKNLSSNMKTLSDIKETEHKKKAIQLINKNYRGIINGR